MFAIFVHQTSQPITVFRWYTYKFLNNIELVPVLNDLTQAVVEVSYFWSTMKMKYQLLTFKRGMGHM